MAKGANSKTGGPSRIRFIMLDAELPEGDLTQITQAIQNALRPNPPSSTRFVAAPTNNATPSNLRSTQETTNAASEGNGDLNEVDSEVADGEDISGASPRPPQNRKYRTPKVVPLDLTSEPAFEEFAASKAPDSDQMRYLVAATWLQEHRGINQVTVDQVYTCFRAVKWPTNIPDFDAPLRKLKNRQLLERAGKGAYSVNHLGLSEVDKRVKA